MRQTPAAIPESFGLGPPNVSWRFIRVSAQQIQALQERRLGRCDVALLLDAKTFALLRLRQELRLVNESAVKIIEERLEKTFTLHGLGVFPVLGVRPKTTNYLESLNALVG